MKLTENAAKAAAARLAPTIRNPSASRRAAATDSVKSDLLVRVEPQGLMYTKVTEDDCESIFEKTVLGGEIVHELLYHEGEKEYMGEDDIPFFQGQTRLVQ